MRRGRVRARPIGEVVATITEKQRMRSCTGRGKGDADCGSEARRRERGEERRMM